MDTMNTNKITRLRRDGGYTLIEIMVVVVIIGILAALVVPNLLSKPDQARVVAAKNDVKSLSSALQLYRLDNLSYPSTEEGLAALLNPPKNGGNQGYIDKVPQDPWGHPYRYLNPGTHNPQSFDIISLGADGAEGGEGVNADIGNWD